MKTFVWLVLSLMTVLARLPSAWAQLDSSTVLLRPGGSSTREGLDSTRYKLRTPESRRDDDSIEETPGTYIPSPVPRNRDSRRTNLGSSKTPSAPVTPPAPAPEEAAAPTPAPVATPAPTPAVPETPPPVTVQVRELIMGGSDEEIEEYKAHIHPEDPRANLVSISLAPAYFYDGSSSNYTFRNYHTDGPGFGLGMNVWFTPFFGIQSKYFASMSSGVRDVSGNVVPLDVQDLEAGIRFRKHFGYSRKSAQLSWGLDYHDSTDHISTDATSVVGTHSSGLSLALEGAIPTSVNYAHTFELNVRPSQHQSETKTSVEVKSGTKCQSNALGLGLGGQWTLDRKNQIFWKGQYSVQRDLYDGYASAIDGHGQQPDGVSVTKSLLIFYFGFRWGS